MATEPWPNTPATALRKYRLDGDPAAFRAIVDRYSGPVVRCVKARGADESTALDVCQETFFVLSRRLMTFDYDPLRSFRSFLYRVVISQECKHHREMPPYADLDSGLAVAKDPETTETSTMATPGASFEDRLEELEARVKPRVKPETWQAYWLIHHERLTANEAADRMGRKFHTVYRAHARVMAMLLREAGRDGEDGQ